MFRRYCSTTLLFQMWLGSRGAEESWCELTYIFSLWHVCLLPHKSLSMTPESGKRCEGIILPLRKTPINLAVRRDSTSVSYGWRTGEHDSIQHWWCFPRMQSLPVLTHGFWNIIRLIYQVTLWLLSVSHLRVKMVSQQRSPLRGLIAKIH